MPVLSAQSIRTRCLGLHNQYPWELIRPFSERTVHIATGTSYGLSAASYDVRLDQEIHLPRGQFILASTIERFQMPPDLMAIVHEKSSLARQGVAVQNTLIDPGWNGYLTLELSNHGSDTFKLPEGSPIAQIVFHLLDFPTEQPYRGKYQDQERGPQEARKEV